MENEIEQLRKSVIDVSEGVGTVSLPPVRCTECKRTLGNKYERLISLVKTQGLTPDEAFTKLGLSRNRYCCRRQLASPQIFSDVAIADLIPEMQKFYTQPVKSQPIRGALSLMTGSKTGPTIIQPPAPSITTTSSALVPTLGTTTVAPIPVKKVVRTARIYSLSHPLLFPPEGKT